MEDRILSKAERIKMFKEMSQEKLVEVLTIAKSMSQYEDVSLIQMEMMDRTTSELREHFKRLEATLIKIVDRLAQEEKEEECCQCNRIKSEEVK